MHHQSRSKEGDAFLAVAADYQLGNLVTEAPHPATHHLSDLATRDLPAACEALKSVDLLALGLLAGRAAAMVPLAGAVRETLAGKGRVFFCGCGATGRLFFQQSAPISASASATTTDATRLSGSGISTAPTRNCGEH